jgi:glycosyltransferase involved in cell wall biosynthesis
MNILTYTSLFPNRVRPVQAMFVYQRTLHLAQRPGNRVEVIAPVPYFPSWLRWSRWSEAGQIPDEEEIGGLRVFHPRYALIPGISMRIHGASMYWGSLGRATEINRRMHLDCIDAHYIYPDGFAAIKLGQSVGVPVIVSARGTDINVFPNIPAIRPKIRWTLENAAGVIAVSAALKNAMVALGVSSEKIAVIPNGVDSERFHPMDRAEARRRLGLPESGRVIVSVAALLRVKGHSFLVDAFAKLAPRHGGLRMYFVGEGKSRGELESQIRALGLADRISLVGSKSNDQLAAWYSAADVMCLASSREGMPNVVLESLACGTPVVATRVGGTPEVIVSEALGVLVNQDAAEIAAALDNALSRDWDRAAIVNHARQRDWKKVAEEVEAFLKERSAPNKHP